MAQWRKVIVSGSDAVLNQITASGAIVPKSDNSVDLGASNLEWKDLYVDGTAYLDSATITAGTISGITDITVADGGTGVSTLTDGGILLGSGTGAITALAVLADGEFVVGDGTTDPVAESGDTARISLGVGSTSTWQITGLNIGAASDTTLTRPSAGDLQIESNIIYRAGGTDVAVADGGTGQSNLTNLITLGTHTTGNYVATLTAGALIDLQNNSGETASPTIDVDLTEAGEAAIANGDYILFLDGGATGTHAKEAVHDLATLFSGTGLTAASSVINIDAAQTGITSIYATDLILGEDSETAIDFGTANEIDFKINNTTELTLDASALYSTVGSGLDLGTSSKEFKDAFFDGTVTSDAFAGPITGEVTGNASTATALASAGTIASSGDVVWTVDFSGPNVTAAATIQANSVEDSMVNDNVATGLAGAGTTATSGVLNVIGGNGITANANDVAITAAQTTITSVYNTGLLIGRASGDTYITFAADDNIDFYAGATKIIDLTTSGIDVTGTLTTSGNVTVGGNLDVNGTLTTIDTANSYVADKFMIIASGSTSDTDGGFIVQSAAGAGYALGYDSGTDRWALDADLAHNATNLVPDAYVGIVQYDTTAGDSYAAPLYGGATGHGTIYVDTDDNEIWIYA